MGTKQTLLVTHPIKVHLYGFQLLDDCGRYYREPSIMGTFERHPVTGLDKKEYALFTVPDSKTYPSRWAGTYRISIEKLKAHVPCVFVKPGDQHHKNTQKGDTDNEQVCQENEGCY